MGGNPRQPVNVWKLITDANARKAKSTPKRPSVSANIHTESSLWSRIRKRKP